MNTDPLAPSTWRRPLLIGGVCVTCVLALIATQSVTALLLLLADGVPAVALLFMLILIGAAVANVVFPGELPLRWRLTIGAGLGIGAFASLAMLAGLCGILDRTTWLIVLTCLVAASVVAIWRHSPRKDEFNPSNEMGDGANAHGLDALWLLVIPFAALTALVAVIPPGFLWSEEGAGYDVLEYHLQLPREYIRQGHIAHTPHNVYGAFPANVEMLYMSCMILCGDIYDGAATAMILNALLAVATVAAAWVVGRDASPGTGVLTAVVTAGVGWLTYLSGVAYVENVMLLFTMIAVGAAMRAIDQSNVQDWPARWLMLSGLMTGFACGCKYTACLLVGLPIAAAVMFLTPGNMFRRARATTVLGIGGLIAFAPWPAKNALLTGNPVFPLANDVFHAYPSGWGETESRHFDESHRPGTDESTATARLETFWRHIPGDAHQRFGPLIFIAAALRLLSRSRNRLDLMLVMIAAMQAAGWFFATHLYARFAVPMIVPFALLAGRLAMTWCDTRWPRAALVALVAAGASFNAVMTTRLYHSHLYQYGAKIPLEGAVGFFLNGMGGGYEHLAVINHELPSDARILMLGDARPFYMLPPTDYCVVFNRNPFVEAVRVDSAPDAILAWLRERGCTHVFVHWAEIRRLRASRYGFPVEINPQLFARLERAGLNQTNTFSTLRMAEPYAALYVVPR